MENTKVKKRRKPKTLSAEERMEVVKLHYLEKVSRNQLAKRYGTCLPAISRIISKFAAENDKSMLLMKNKPTDSQSEEIKALQREIIELKQKLYNETMRADFYDTMIDVAEEMFNIEIRKKADTGQPKGCTEKSDIQ